MTPAEALERVALLMERSGAPSTKVRAFRRAADVVAGVEEDRLRELAGSGRLTSLPGVGPSTAAVAAQALTGAVPDRLAALEAERTAEPALTGPAAALRAALQGDCHSHTEASDGGSPLLAMARAARDVGHAWLAVTDHSEGLRVANGLSPARRRAQWAEVDEVNAVLAREDAPPLRVLRGIEVDIREDGSLDAAPDLLEATDVVVASVHSRLRSDAATMTRRMLTALADPHVDVLGHCTGRRVVEPVRPPSVFDADAVFAAAAAGGVAVEVNSRPERLDPPRDLLRAALAAGCALVIDTDAHAPGQLDWQHLGAARAVECGAGARDVLNTLGAEELLAELAARRARRGGRSRAADPAR